jgi:DNA polymerase-3 subunit epsilon
MREIVLDTETTGLDPDAGHRVLEIGCVEVVNHLATDKHLQLYINPERDIPEESIKVHGLTEEFLKDKPTFAEVADEFLDFIAGDPLIIHNAAFDMKFLNAELTRLGRPALDFGRAVDTVQIARKRFPGAQVNLDALCRRFDIDLSARTLHGALLDCQLLAEVYLELRGGRQPGFNLNQGAEDGGDAHAAVQVARPLRAPRPHAPGEDEREAHRAMLEKIKDPIWLA